MDLPNERDVAAETVLVEGDRVGRAYRQGNEQVVALESATFKVCRGDHIALVGRSGSGKSTLLHLMGGLDRPTTGRLHWPRLGSPETLRPSKVTFVFQMASLIAPLTVLENVALPLLLNHVPEQVAQHQAIATLEQLSLEALAYRLPEELSGGQAQRVAIARALAGQPQLILADEPTGQLDHPTAEALLDAWFETLAGTNTALVIATHDGSVAARLNQRWEIERGRLRALADATVKDFSLPKI